MLNNWLELVIIAVILIGIAVAIFKGGAANPVGTGALRSRLVALDGDLRSLNSKVGTVETRVAELDQRAATKGDIARIEAQFTEWHRLQEGIVKKLSTVDVDLGRLNSVVQAKNTVIEAMAESQRVTNAALQNIEKRVEANAIVSDQVPDFMKSVLTNVAHNTARTEEVCKQVDRLYDFIVERGFSK